MNDELRLDNEELRNYIASKGEKVVPSINTKPTTNYDEVAQALNKYVLAIDEEFNRASDIANTLESLQEADKEYACTPMVISCDNESGNLHISLNWDLHTINRNSYPNLANFIEELFYDFCAPWSVEDR